MPNSAERPLGQSPDRPAMYRIVLEGHLGSQWSDWFTEFQIMLDQIGWTYATEPVDDQTTLHGLLKKVRGPGMPLISVNRIDLRTDATNEASAGI